jgi:ubiquitin-conjugating enzyme E2 Q
MYTGHVTAGGSICVEALTLSGSQGSWKPDYSVEGLLNLIIINMVRTVRGFVGGMGGGGGWVGMVGGRPILQNLVLLQRRLVWS